MKSTTCIVCIVIQFCPPHPRLILDQTKARRAEKNFFEDPTPPPPPLSKGLDDRTPSPLSPPYLRDYISYRSALIDEEHFEIPEIFEEFGLCHGQSHQRCTPANKQFANLYLINATACTLCTSLFFYFSGTMSRSFCHVTRLM